MRVTGILFTPDGEGPFPAVLTVHGHSNEGKLGRRVQIIGHLLAQRDYVVLLIDGPGSGERGDRERVWQYHGGFKGGAPFLVGDSLMGWQVRDNQRALDLLANLPFVDPKRIGMTGASGGGNQTMWTSALDQRVSVVVPVVSVGSFEAYITRRNCICETLPGGLQAAEEWEVLGLVAPRPLLILNSIHDQPAFGVPAVGFTARHLQEVYELFHARSRFDHRLLDQPHGYWPPMQEALLGWMDYWLKGEGNATPTSLPSNQPYLMEELLCYPPGEWPGDLYSYPANKKIIHARNSGTHQKLSGAGTREKLAELVGWQAFTYNPSLVLQEKEGFQVGILTSPRELPIPLLLEEKADPTNREVSLFLSPEGKSSAFVQAQWEKGRNQGGAALVSLDLPCTGELQWDGRNADPAFHDSTRACLWLGYTLAAEWAEVIACVLVELRSRYPQASLRIVAEKETALAALLAMVLGEEQGVTLEEHGTPESWEALFPRDDTSLLWAIPKIKNWGELSDLRALAHCAKA